MELAVSVVLLCCLCDALAVVVALAAVRRLSRTRTRKFIAHGLFTRALILRFALRHECAMAARPPMMCSECSVIRPTLAL